MKPAFPIFLAIGAGLTFAKVNWKPLFNGRTLEPEWYVTGDTKHWKVDPVDSAIVGLIESSSPSASMVFTQKKDFDKFTIKYAYRLKAGCSGFFFRSKDVNTAQRVAGMQVEAKYLPSIGNSEVGSLYCHTCGDWEVQHSQAYSNKIRKPEDQYQEVILTVNAQNIYVNVNGFQAVGETDLAEISAGAARAYNYTNTGVINTPGNLGLQIHENQPAVNVRFKNISILEGCGDATKPGYDGAIVPGFPKQPAVFQDNNSCNPTGIIEKKAHLLEHFGAMVFQDGKLALEISYPEKHTLDIINLDGKVVFSGSAPSAHDYKIGSKLESGVYFARIQADKVSASRKIILR